MKLRKIFLAAPLALCACATVAHVIEWVPAGPSFAPKKTEEVAVFRSKAEVKHPFGVIALLHGWRVPAGDTKSLEKQIARAREIAAQNGADAIVADEINQALEPSPFTPMPGKTPETHIYGIAIKYTDSLTGPERKIIENWQP
ncbi:MAG: hypothetical protein PHP45_01625 [Elusimicrobiales bacterium]|nr:hypothetical protein [Elusimicrobiales bacterium]